MKASLPLPETPENEPAGGGELIVVNGRLEGMRRPLGMPLTCIGRAAGCEMRVTGDGVQAHHCVLVRGEGGLVLRDLQTKSGTFVNGQRVANATLQDGDLIGVGAYQLRLSLTASAAFSERDALRAQAAAVAAQQMALTEEEERLHQRRAVLEQQEQQLAAHLEEKHRQVLELSEATAREKEVLAQERVAQDERFQQLTEKLTQARHEVSQRLEKTQADRGRLARLGQRLRQRGRRLMQIERSKADQRESELCQEERNLDEWAQRMDEREAALVDKRLRFNGMVELGRRQLRDAWERLRDERSRWKHRRGRERAALKVRDLDLEAALRQLATAQRFFLREKGAWDEGKRLLDLELAKVDGRVENQRQILAGLDRENRRIDAEISARREVLAHLSPVEEQAGAELLDGRQESEDRGQESGDRGQESGDRAEEAAVGEVNPVAEARVLDLDSLAGALADQRWQLVQAWQRLAQVNRNWEEERERAGRELDDMSRRLLERGWNLIVREEDNARTEERLEGAREALMSLRQQMLAWRARLKVRENAWEVERSLIEEHAREREAQVDQQLRRLDDTRKRWTRRRRQETKNLQQEWSRVEALRRETAALRLELTRKAVLIEDEKRIVGDKSLALEQYRQEFINRNPNPPAAERRLERLRRRWLAQNARALRAVTAARQALYGELAELERMHADLASRTDAVAAAETAFREEQAAWEHESQNSAVNVDRLQLALDDAENNRNHAEDQLAQVREEVEQIAMALLEETSPVVLPLEKAA